MPLGLVEATAQQYHGDEIADRPTLSKSIIQILLNASPAHARHAHPKLNPNFERKEETKFDLGNAVHQVFLEGIDAVAVLPYKDFKSNAAKDDRDQARADGRIPLLTKDYERVEEMIVAIRAQLATRDDALFENGHAEQTITWTDRGVACRARLDWLTDDQTEIHDLKTSDSANPDRWCRSIMFRIGADVQAQFYARGVEAITGSRPTFTFLVAETAAPYMIKPIAIGPDVATLADKKIDYALNLWRRCLERDEWPGYDGRIAYADLPPWMEGQWLEREMREEVAA